MYADRHQQKRINPGSLGAAIAINGAVLAALIFSTPHIIPFIPDKGIEAYPVPLPVDPPPPPEPQPRPPEARTAADPPIAAPRPRIAVPDTPRPSITTTDGFPALPPIGPATDTGTGAGTGIVAVDPPVAVPVRVGAAIDPRYRDAFQPPYPPSERRAEREGVVVVRVTIGIDGRVRAIEPLSATTAAFYEATRRQALSRWRFTPATVDGVAVEATRDLTLRFELRD